MIEDVLAIPVFDNQRYPPYRDVNAGVVVRLDHSLQRIAGEGFRARFPVATGREPSRIQSCPTQTELLQLGDCAQHLLGSEVHLVSPAAPVRLIVGFRGMGKTQTAA